MATSYMGLLGGGVAGTVLLVVGRDFQPASAVAAGVLVAAGPVAGAVIGYNQGRSQPGAPATLGARLELPQLAMRYETPDEVPGFVVYDARLVTVKF